MLQYHVTCVYKSIQVDDTRKVLDSIQCTNVIQCTNMLFNVPICYLLSVCWLCYSTEITKNLTKKVFVETFLLERYLDCPEST